MLDQQDLQAIGQLMDEKMDIRFKTNNVELGKMMDEKIKANNKELVGMIGEMVEEMILPRIDTLEHKVDSLENKVNSLDKKVDSLDKTVTNLPTKSYLDAKLADAVSDTVKLIDKRQAARDRIDRDYKTTVMDIVEAHDLATAPQLSALKRSLPPMTPSASSV